MPEIEVIRHPSLEWIAYIYAIPVVIGHLGVLVWWIWFSPKEKVGYHPNDRDDDFLWACLWLWPLTLLAAPFVGALFLVCVCSFMVEAARENRISRR